MNESLSEEVGDDVTIVDAVYTLRILFIYYVFLFFFGVQP